MLGYQQKNQNMSEAILQNTVIIVPNITSSY